MKAALVNRPGGPEVLQLVDLPEPELKPGWSRIKIKGFGLNHSEVFTREGKSPSVQFPRVLGIEAVGIIDATTSKKLTLGAKVVTLMGEMGRAFDGSYAEYVLVPNEQIYPISNTLNFTWAELAAIPETFYTAFGIFKSLQIQPNDRILIRAVTSGVGIAALKLIKSLPFPTTVIGTSRSQSKTAQLKQLGLDNILITPDANNLPTGTTNFDKIIDLIGPSAVRDSLKHLNEFGIVSSTGQLGGQWTLNDFDPITDIPNNRYLTGFYSGDVTENKVQNLFDYLQKNHVDVKPEKVFKLNQIQEAHEYLAASHGLGKVVVLPI